MTLTVDVSQLGQLSVESDIASGDGVSFPVGFHRSCIDMLPSSSVDEFGLPNFFLWHDCLRPRPA